MRTRRCTAGPRSSRRRPGRRRRGGPCSCPRRPGCLSSVRALLPLLVAGVTGRRLLRGVVGAVLVVGPLPGAPAHGASGGLPQHGLVHAAVLVGGSGLLVHALLLLWVTRGGRRWWPRRRSWPCRPCARPQAGRLARSRS